MWSQTLLQIIFFFLVHMSKNIAVLAVRKREVRIGSRSCRERPSPQYIQRIILLFNAPPLTRKFGGGMADKQLESRITVLFFRWCCSFRSLAGQCKLEMSALKWLCPQHSQLSPLAWLWLTSPAIPYLGSTYMLPCTAKNWSASHKLGLHSS